MRPWLRSTLRFTPWALAVGVGFAFAFRFEGTAGEAASAPTTWPAATSVLPAGGGKSTLLLFAHPRCPCTRATLSELSLLLTHEAAAVEARVLFVRPPGVELGWERSDLWETASRIPGLRVIADPDGAEARRFGAVVSGQVLLFAPDGSLRFSGGITASRGHQGDNPGRSAIEALLEGRPSTISTTPVFGCRLLAGACDGKAAVCKP